MPINTALFANPQIGAAYGSDPRLGYAQALMQGGASTAPVQSWGEGLARALQGGLGGYQTGQVRRGYQAQDASYRAALAAALKGDDPLTALAQSSDPTLQQEGLQQQLALAQSKAKSKIELQNTLAAKGLSVDANGNIVPLSGFGSATGQIANEANVAQIPGKVQELQATGPVNAQNAALSASAVSPITTQTAVNTAAATAPIDIKKAADTAAAVAPIETKKAQDVYGTTQGPQNLQNNKEKLADDYRADPNVKSYQVVQPIMESMKQAAATDTRAAALNMIYGFAKIMDPNSVVREGEQVLVQGTGAIQDTVTNLLSKIQGGQPLTAQTRAELLAQAQSRVDQLKGVYDQAQGFYATQAQKLGLKPNDVLYQLPLASAPGISTTPASEVTATGPNGQKLILQNGQWVPK